jgi:chaperonin GroEL
MKLSRIVESGTRARNKLATGADKLANLVKGTLGPFGYNIFLDKNNKVTNDGAKIANEVVFDDELENRGAIALREVTTKTNDEVGDGTTTSITLAQAIYQAAVRQLSDEERQKFGSVTPAQLIKQIETERAEITDKLVAMSEPITTEAQLINSAIVSVEDKELGKLIGEAQFALGPTGILIAEETTDRECSVENVRGVRIDNGVGTGIIFNDAERQCLDVENTFVILTSHTIEDFRAIEPILKQIFSKPGNQLAIVARAFSSNAIRLCLENINGGNKIFPLNAPYVDQADVMKDMSAVLGATYFHDEGSHLEDMQMSDVGFATRVRATRFDAIFTGVEDERATDRVNARVKELEEKFKGSPSIFEKRNLESRIAQLSKGFGIVKVGSSSDLERKRLFDKCEDAVNAVRAAYQEGVVPGAGLAFKTISDSLPDTYLLKRPITAIYEQIMSTAPTGWVVEDWVKDPVKVLRIALKNACTAAATFATAGGVITAKNPPKLDDLLKGRTNDDSNES